MGWDSIIAECRTLKRPKFCIFCTIYLKCHPSFEWPLVAILLTCLPASLSIMEVRGQRHVKISWVPENLVAHCIDQKTFSNVRFIHIIGAHISMWSYLWGLTRKICHIIWCFDKGWGWKDAEGVSSRVLPLSPHYTCRQSQRPHLEFQRCIFVNNTYTNLPYFQTVPIFTEY